MTDTQKISTAFPPPPPQYKKFTTEALDSLKSNHNLDLQEDPYLYFAPPLPPQENEYVVFGEAMKLRDTDDKEQSGTELNPVKHTPKDLQKLNFETILEYLNLVKTLSDSPDNFKEHTTRLKALFSKLTLMVNDYRENQAVETLKLIVQRQAMLIERSQLELEETQELARKELEAAKKEALEIATRILKEMNEEQGGEKLVNPHSFDLAVDKSPNTGPMDSTEIFNDLDPGQPKSSVGKIRAGWSKLLKL